MSEFTKYLHVEKLSTKATNGLTNGLCYIFPKLDGSNASIWLENESLHFGSRNRELPDSEDLNGFRETMLSLARTSCFFSKSSRHFQAWFYTANG